MRAKTNIKCDNSQQHKTFQLYCGNVSDIPVILWLRCTKHCGDMKLQFFNWQFVRMLQ